MKYENLQRITNSVGFESMWYRENGFLIDLGMEEGFYSLAKHIYPDDVR